MARIRRLLGAIAVIAAIAGLVNANGAGGANSTTFSGRATVIQGKVLGIALPCVASIPSPPDCNGIGDTGNVALGGGELETSLLCYSFPSDKGCLVNPPDLTSGDVRARALHAAVVAHGNTSRAEASVADFAANVNGIGISADFLMANAFARCTNGQITVGGSSEVARVNGQPVLVINGVSYTVQETPNFPVIPTLPAPVQALFPPGSEITINKQDTSQPNGITVTALYVKIPGVLPGTDTELSIAQAHADIASCGNAPGNCVASKVTGGGWITKADGNRLNFSVAARELTPWGHFHYIDHGAGDTFKATSVDALTFDATDTAVVTGAGELNGVGSTPFKVLVKDNGEPGRGADTFELVLPTKIAKVTLSGGNIQFHKCK